MTKLLYLSHPELSNCSSKILEIIDLENDQQALVLDQSVFYVQGGGQPSDQGTVYNNNGVFIVSKVIANELGKILHIGNFNQGRFNTDEQVELKIDAELRNKHSKIHSAGHLIDLAIHNLNLDWQPGKGMHYPESSFVEYQYSQLPENLESIQSQIQQEIDHLIQQNITVNISIDDTKTFKGQPLRQVDFEDKSKTPCGGTHVASTSLLEGTIITKLKAKNGIVKISYTCLN